MNQFIALCSLFLFTISLSLFLLPGFAVTAIVSPRRNWCGERALIVTIAASATLGYAAFWAYFEGRLVGRIFSYGVIAASIGVVVVMLKRECSVRALARSMAAPLGYVLATGICYTCLLFLFQNPFATGAELANVRFFSEIRSGDNQIPLIFAERIYAQKPVEPFCCGDWRSSDRPPLQAGIFLLQRPLKVFGNVRLNYQLLGTGLQCLWICGVWVFLKSLRAEPRRIKQVLGFLIFSGFLFYNTVYVWPKLLAATFVLFLFSILAAAWQSSRQLTWFETGLAAINAAVAIMAHPGSIFSAPAMLAVLIWKRQLWSTPKVLVGALLIAIFAAPWAAYQKFYDPPGNRLLKMHLAGVGPVDARSTWRAIGDAYGSKSLGAIARDKWENVRTLIGPHPFAVMPGEVLRILQRDYIWNALWILNAGWVAMALARFRKNAPALPCSGLLIGIAISNLMVWCGVLIGPGYTITATSSYTDLLLLGIGLLGFSFTLPRVFVAVLFVLQVLNLFVVWVFVRPALIERSALQWPLLTAGIVCALALIWHFGRAIWEPMRPASPDASPECPLRY